MTPPNPLHTMSWLWIGAALVVPTIAGFLVALPFWLLKYGMAGNVAGGFVIMLGTLMSVFREASSLFATRLACAKAGTPCHFSPDDFTRYAIYAGIGFFEVALLFMIGLTVEERQRRRRG